MYMGEIRQATMRKGTAYCCDKCRRLLMRLPGDGPEGEPMDFADILRGFGK